MPISGSDEEYSERFYIAVHVEAEAPPEDHPQKFWEVDPTVSHGNSTKFRI